MKMITIYRCPVCGANITEDVLPFDPPVRRLYCEKCEWEYEEEDDGEEPFRDIMDKI